MKKICLLFCVELFIISAFSQKPSVGFLVGLNISNLGNDNSYKMKSKPGFHAGVLVPISLSSKFSLHPGTSYSNQGAQYNTNDGIKHSLHLNYINIPLQFQYRFTKHFSVQTGPQVAMLIDTKDKVAGNETGFFTPQDFKTFDLLWSAGIDYHKNVQWGINARYNCSVGTINNGGVNPYKNRVFQLGFFYLLKTNHKTKLR